MSIISTRINGNKTKHFVETKYEKLLNSKIFNEKSNNNSAKNSERNTSYTVNQLHF